MFWDRFRRSKPEPPRNFTGNCLVRQHTMDGNYVGRCYHSTYDYVCPVHGNVHTWLPEPYEPFAPDNYKIWPKDYDLESAAGNTR